MSANDYDHYAISGLGSTSAHILGIVGVAAAAMMLAGGVPIFAAQMAATTTALGAVATTLMSSVPSAVLLGTTSFASFYCAHRASQAHADLQNRDHLIDKASKKGEMPQLSTNKWLDPDHQPAPFLTGSAKFIGACATVAGGLLLLNTAGLALIGSGLLIADLLQGAALAAIGGTALHASKAANNISNYAQAYQHYEQQRLHTLHENLAQKQPAPPSKETAPHTTPMQQTSRESPKTTISAKDVSHTPSTSSQHKTTNKEASHAHTIAQQRKETTHTAQETHR